MLSNRCAAVLSIANTDNKHGRFDSTKFSEGFPENLVLSNRCASVLSIANAENKQGRFDSTNFSGGFSVINLVLSNLCYPSRILTTNMGGSIAPNFVKGFLSENLMLSNRCAAVLSMAVRKHQSF